LQPCQRLEPPWLEPKRFEPSNQYAIYQVSYLWFSSGFQFLCRFLDVYSLGGINIIIIIIIISSITIIVSWSPSSPSSPARPCRHHIIIIMHLLSPSPTS
jgi:hypothetical protein